MPKKPTPKQRKKMALQRPNKLAPRCSYCGATPATQDLRGGMACALHKQEQIDRES